MTQKTKERIHLIYGIVLSALVIAVGVCFALSCLSIYQSGDASPYTVESISAHFRRIAIPTYTCLAGVIGGIVLSVVLPVTAERITPRRHPEDALAGMRARVDITACDSGTAAAIRRERVWRRRVTAILGVPAGITLLPALIRCVNPTHFSVENLNADIRTASLFVIPGAVASLGLCVAAAQLRRASALRETELLKKAALQSFSAKYSGRVIVGSPCAATTSDKPAPSGQKVPADKKGLAANPYFMWGMRGVILAVGALFILLGILNGGMADVLGKAIRICTECIGLG